LETTVTDSALKWGEGRVCCEPTNHFSIPQNTLSSSSSPYFGIPKALGKKHPAIHKDMTVDQPSSRKRKLVLSLACLAMLAACGDGSDSGISPVASSPHSNPVMTENQLQGTADWRLTLPAMNREIEGYASATSINHGGSISFYVNTTAPAYTIEVFRMGWYGGAGGRRVLGPIQAPGIRQAIPTLDSIAGFLECAWINPYTLSTGNDWTSGIYLAKLTESAASKQSYIIFVVRNDEAASHFLYELPVTTYQAYNFWGGKSLYGYGSGNQLPWGTSDGKLQSFL
jgi:hypothetical protein